MDRSTGRLHLTRDGGRTWTARDLPLGGAKIFAGSYYFAAMSFPDAEHGLVVLSYPGDPKTLWAYQTADGGRSWRKEQILKGAKLVESFKLVSLARDARTLTATDGKDIAVLRLAP